MSVVDGREDPAPRVRSVLAPFADEFREAAKTADTLAASDACEVLAAVATGEPVPTPQATRIMDRVEERDR